MLGVILVAMFVFFVAVGVPISFALGIVSFTGIAALPDIPNTVVFTKMFNGLNSFTLLAVPLFILAANLMQPQSFSASSGVIAPYVLMYCKMLSVCFMFLPFFVSCKLPNTAG